MAVLMATLSARSMVARAQEAQGEPESPASEAPGFIPVIHGFVSQGFILTTANNYLAQSEHGSFEFTEVGVNLTSQLTDDLRAGVQLFARDLGPIGNYSAKFDWFYLDYRFEDWLGIRAGRTKLPFGLYNDTNDIDVAHVPILMPQSVYPIENRDFLLAQTGVELYGRAELGAGGALDYRAYGGTIFLDVGAPAAGSPFTVESFTIPYVVGGRLMWETPVEGLRLGGSVQVLKLESTLLYGTGAMAMRVSVDIPATLWVTSVEYASSNLLVAIEYGRWHVSVDSSDPMLFPEQTVVSERGYVMASYRFTPWFQPGIYYSLLFPNVDDRDGRDSRQHDLAATARFDINEHWLVKLEAHYMNGTAALRAALNDGAPPSALTRDWAVFLVKTTAYF